MFVVFHFSLDPRPGEILYIYSAKEDLNMLRERYRSFMASFKEKPSSKPFIDELVNEGLIVLNKVLRSPFQDLDREEMEFYRQVQHSKPFTVI
jgi:hypothetical protein